jgi:RNA polymerase sigma-70 factor, ECF subfamily
MTPAVTKTIYLVSRAQKGDQQALDGLLRRYLPVVEFIVSMRMGKKLQEFADQGDVVQEVLIDVLQGIERFSFRTDGSFKNWLSRCVECAIVDQARKANALRRGQGKVRRFGDCRTSLFRKTFFAHRGPTPSQVIRGKEMEERLEKALLELPRHYREVIILRNFCGLPYEEIAREMRFAEETTARKAHSRALSKLKGLLGE